MPTNIPQRLAAILAADIAGYTHLMELDEAGTVAAWRQARADVIDPIVARDGGRIVKLTGDGFLAEFPTVESAVKAALAMQAAFASLFGAMPRERRVAFRMGVNVGDIWVDADDIYGAGVNVSARLQALAQPGGICISDAVRDAVKHKITAHCEDLGHQSVKNVAEPIRVWHIPSDEPGGDSAALPPAAPNETRTATADRAPLARPRPAARTLTLGTWLGVAALLIIAVVGTVVVGGFFRRPAEQGELVRLSISSPGQVTPQTSVVISPDGQRVAYVGTDANGRSMLWIRELGSLAPRVLPGTEDAAHPFWSPDGNALGFIAGGKVKRVEARGGGVLVLADVSVRGGATWGRSGIIVFTRRVGELASVPAGGGPVSTVLTRDGVPNWPAFLPDGRHFLFHLRGAEDNGVYVGELGTDTASFVTDTDFGAVYAAPGYLLFVRGETLLAQPFDAKGLTLSGEPRVVAEGIWGAAGAARASFSVSANGQLAYVNATLWDTQLTMVDRSGRSLGAIAPPARVDVGPEISPDGSRLAISKYTTLTPAIWLVTLETGASVRATFAAYDTEPLWSSDPRRFLFASRATPLAARLLVKAADGDRVETEVARLTGATHAWDWSADGRFVVYGKLNDAGSADLWILALEGEGKTFPFEQSSVHKAQAQIAPNGRWIAYTSYESGRDEVYVQSFPQPGEKRQISSAGGMQPRWRPDGKELFFLGADQYLMAVPVATEGAFEAGQATRLFRTRLVPQGSQSVWFPTMYDVMPDGQRFVIDGPPQDPGAPITVVLNWTAALRR